MPECTSSGLEPAAWVIEASRSRVGAGDSRWKKEG